MGLQGYVGSAADQNRIRMLEKQREEERDRIEKAKEESKAKPMGFRNWQQATTEVIETALKADTIGLISRDEYLQRKATVQHRLEAEEKDKKRKLEEARNNEIARKHAVHETKRKAVKLSFLDDEDDDEGNSQAEDDWGDAVKAKLSRVVKNDEVDTSFLPDAERENAMADARDSLRKKWQSEQEELKKKRLKIKFSYWDGSGHQAVASVTVGDTIADFLKAARVALEKDFPNLRHATVSNLLLVAHNILVPQACTFHRLIVGKAHNKKGDTLFELEGQQKGKLHTVKVLQRHWYESNKHIYPASSWQMFDEDLHMT